MPIPKHIKPAIGGLLLGILALTFPQVMTGGYGWVQWGAIGMPPVADLAGEKSFVPHMGMWMLLTLAVLKIVATGLTISSGGSGGVFGPSMLIGGMLGGALRAIPGLLDARSAASSRPHSFWSEWEASSPAFPRRR